MKNIRSNSIAALSLMLLLSTTASHGISYNSIVTASKAALQPVTNAAKAAVDAVVAHPYITIAAIATPVVGYGLYKYAFGKKATKPALNELNPAFNEKDTIFVKSQNDILTRKAEQALIAHFEPTSENIAIRANQVLKTLMAFVKDNSINKAKTLNEAQRTQVQEVLTSLGVLIAQLDVNSEVSIAASQLYEAVSKLANSDNAINELEGVLSAIEALKAIKVDPTSKPATKKTLTQKVAAKLPTRNQALFGTAVAVPVIAGSIYGYKNGYLTSAINKGLSFFGSAKNLTFSKNAVAPVIGQSISSAAMESLRNYLKS